MPVDLLVGRKKPRDLLSSSQSPYDETYFAQGTSGVNEGIANVLGLPVDIANTAIGLGMRGANRALGTELQPSQKPFLGSRFIREGLEDIGSIRPESQDPRKQVVRRIGQEVGASVVPGGTVIGQAARPVRAGAKLLASSVGSGTGGAIAEQVAPDNAIAEMAGQVIGGGFTAGGLAAAERRARNKAFRSTIPSIEGLKDQASKQYDAAEALGVTASSTITKQIAQDIRKIATNEGVITPTGRIAKGYPKVRDVINAADDYAQGTMTVPQMKAARKTFQAAAQSADKGESRIGTIMLEQFDDTIAPIAQPLTEARALYHAAMKAETLDQAKELAGSRAGQFSGSGFENALRTEFRGLERAAIKDKFPMRGFTPDERAAVSRVAQGTRGSNIARGFGKLAPTGVVSGGVNIMPALTGVVTGNPMAGAAVSGAMAGTGIAGRAIATRMGLNNAELAELLVRNQGALTKAPAISDEMRRIIAALTIAQGANANAR